MSDSVKGRFGAYTVAAGAVLAAAGTANAAMMVYDNGGAGWYDGCDEWAASAEMIQFGYDGVVLVDAAITTHDANSFCLEHDGAFNWDNNDVKDASTLRTAANTGFVQGATNTPASDVARLGADFEISAAALADGRTWREGDYVGGFQGYQYFGYGEWFFGGRGFVGLYSDEADGRHFGWADITTGPARNEFTLHSFAFSDTAGVGVLAGAGEVPEPATMGLLALGAAGLIARRKRA